MPYRYYERSRPYRCYEEKKYGFWNFIGDAVMVLLTSGLWIIWIFVREMRRRN